MRLRTILVLAVVFLLTFALMGCGQDQAAPADSGDSKVVQGEAIGYNPDVPIKVEVTVDGGRIANINVLEHEETPGLSDPAFEQIPAAIIEAQSTNVDVVTNATDTSKGIMQAVEDALSK